LKKTINLLKPFEAVTKEMSATCSFVSEVIPMVATLKLYLTKERGGEFSGVGTMKETLLQDLNKRLGSITDNENYYLASILDPRFKFAFFNANEKENAKEKIISIMEMEINKKVETETNSESEMTTFEDAKKTEESGLSLWDCFAEITNTKSNSEQSDYSPAKELEEYLNKPLLPRTNCPLDWWKENKKEFPRLSSLAKRYLSAPGSSIYSKRLFSEAGNVYKEKRNRILPKNAETLVFLHHNLKLCDK